jgi:hypothetical protein
MRDVNPESGLIVTGNMDRKIKTLLSICGIIWSSCGT